MWRLNSTVGGNAFRIPRVGSEVGSPGVSGFLPVSMSRSTCGPKVADSNSANGQRPMAVRCRRRAGPTDYIENVSMCGGSSILYNMSSARFQPKADQPMAGAEIYVYGICTKEPKKW
jgi:hypothetical protein